MIRGGKLYLVSVGLALTTWSAVDAAEKPEAEQRQTELRDPVRDPEHIFQRQVWSWSELKDRNVVKQHRDYSCGAASLCTVLLHYWGDKVTEQTVLDELDRMLKPDERRDRIKNGLSLTDLRRVSVKLGYVASIGTLSFDQLSKSKIPVVVPLKLGEFNHFVVFRGTDGFYVYLADPTRGNIRTEIAEFVKQWQKNAILVVAKKDRDLNDSSPLRLSEAESYLGTLNRFIIQKQVTQPTALFPAGSALMGMHDAFCRRTGCDPPKPTACRRPRPAWKQKTRAIAKSACGGTPPPSVPQFC